MRVKAIYRRYHLSDRQLNKVIVSEFCSNTRYHWKRGIRLLNGPPPGQARPPPAAPSIYFCLLYRSATLRVLRVARAAHDHLWSVRLKVLLLV